MKTLVAAIAVMAVAGFGDVAVAQFPPGNASNAGNAKPAGPVNPLAQHSLDSLSSTRNKPLFSPTRKPPEKPLAAPAVVNRSGPAEEVPPPQLSLFGIVSDPDGVRALIKLPTNQTLRVRVGDEISGWTVSQIEPRRLVLTLDKRTAVFVLFGDKEMRQEPAKGRQRV